MHGVHHAAAEGFAAGAQRYAAGRPEYPPEVVGWLATELDLGPGKTVVDLGAGTGKFSRHLLMTGADVVAVEPVAAMLEQLTRGCPEIAVRTGTADSIPVPDASVDAVVCAQSFHWFATREALREIERVLRPGGSLGLVWNVRDEGVPWVAALTRLVEPFAGETPRFHTGAWREVFPHPGFSELHERRLRHAHHGSPEQVVVDRTMSISFLAALVAEDRLRVERAVRALVAETPELAGKENVAFPYETAMFRCVKLP